MKLVLIKSIHHDDNLDDNIYEEDTGYRTFGGYVYEDITDVEDPDELDDPVTYWKRIMGEFKLYIRSELSKLDMNN